MVREIDRPTPNALAFGGDERLEKLCADLRRNAGAGIGDGDLDHVVRHQSRRDNEFATFGMFHRLDGIAHQIKQDLLNLHLVGEDKMRAWIELEAHPYTLVLEPHQRQRAGFLHQLVDILARRGRQNRASGE
jgi:hypothetical protein